MTIDASSAEVTNRKVSLRLGLGIAILPGIFVWFLLKQGYSKASRIVGFGWAGIILLAVIGGQSDKAPNTSPSAAPAPAPTMASNSPAPAPSEDATPPSKWAYRDITDDMRGIKGKIAAIDANEELDFDFPYNGGSTATLNLRKDIHGLNVYLKVSKGQFLCNSFSNTTVAVKFDKGPIRHVGCTDTNDGSTDTIFLRGERPFIQQLKQAQKVTIEATFFQAGTRQMTFDVAGLDWK